MIEKMLKTLQEMNNGSVHHENDVNQKHTPDYFDHKNKIEMNVKTLLQVKSSLEGID